MHFAYVHKIVLPGLIAVYIEIESCLRICSVQFFLFAADNYNYFLIV